MMRAAILMVLMTAVTGTVMGQEKKSEWRFIGGSTTGADFFAKSDSRTKVNGTGDASYQIDAKHVRPNGQVRLIRYRISERDCQRGQGLIYEFLMDGTQTARNDFALNTNSTAASIAKYICAGT